MFNFLKKNSAGTPFLGAFLTTDKRFLFVRRRLIFRQISYMDKRLLLELSPTDFERKKLIRENAEWVVVKVKSKLSTHTTLEVRFHDIQIDEQKKLEHTLVANCPITYTAITWDDFLIWLNTTNNVRHQPLAINIRELTVVQMEVDQIMQTIRNVRKHPSFKLYKDIIDRINSFHKYLSDSKNGNKLTSNWVLYCTQLDKDVLEMTSRIKGLKLSADKISELPASISSSFEGRGKSYLVASKPESDTGSVSSKKSSKYSSIASNKKTTEKVEKVSLYTKATQDSVSKKREPINILLVGPGGSGKTTLLNSIKNYLYYDKMGDARKSVHIPIPTEFTITDIQGKSAVIRCGGGKPKEQFLTYECQFGENTYHFIDTPGLAETQAPEDYLQVIQDFVSSTSVHVICVVVKSNECRESLGFVNFVKTIPQFVNISKNILFVFTNTSSTFYKSGDSKPAITQILKGMNVTLNIDNNNLFCFDNEAFRYLSAINHIKFTNYEQDAYNRSWTVSSAETKRFLANISFMLNKSNRKELKRVESVIQYNAPLSIEQAKLDIPAPKDTFNILVVGPPKSGKTTLINAFLNYTSYLNLTDAEGKVKTEIPISFMFSPANYREISIKKVSDNKTNTCEINYNNKHYLLLDTPGIKDETTFMSHIEQCTRGRTVHAVLLVINATDTTLPTFVNIIPKLRDHSKNILVAYTHSALRHYKSGDTFDLLKTLCQSLSPPIFLDTDRVFCVDNEPYRYLCAFDEVKFEKLQKKQFESSWQKSSTEAKRLLEFTVNPTKPSIRLVPPKLVQPPDTADINILLLGPSGSGKTTLINSISNYILFNDLESAENKVNTAIPNKFVIKVRNKVVPIECGSGPPSRSFHVYNFNLNHLSYSLIDTPGFTESKSSEDYLKTVFNFVKDRKINYIWLVFKTNESRSSSLVVSFIRAIPKCYQICQNITFCFTHASTTFYKYGDTLPIIQNNMIQMGVPLSLTQNHIFCFENDPYRYLSSLNKLSYSNSEVENYKRSWSHSHAETYRLFKELRGPTLKPTVAPPPPPVSQEPSTTEYSAFDKGINVLVVGPAGAGKTTFINSVANYVKYSSLSTAASGKVVNTIPCEFQITLDDQQVSIQCGDPNTTRESLVVGYGGVTVRLIDTPGYGDNVHARYLEQINTMIKNYKVKVLCVILKSNEGRAHAMLSGFLSQIKSLSNQCEHIVFCLTHSSSSMYQLGDTYSVLMESLKDTNIPLTDEYTYPVDNEAFRYLNCYNMVQFEELHTKMYETSWKKSTEECKRLLEFLKQTYPPKKDVLDLSEIQDYIARLTTSVILKINQVTVEINKKNKLQYQMIDTAAQRKSLSKRTIDATIQIDPLYFCISETCPNFSLQDKGEQVWKFDVLKSHHCRIVTTKGICASCHCPVKTHLRVDQIVHKQDIVVEVETPVAPNLQAEEEKLEKNILKLKTDISIIVDDIMNLTLYVKNSTGPDFVDYFEESISSRLDDPSVKANLKEEMIRTKQDYQRKMVSVTKKSITPDYLQQVSVNSLKL